jgi:hypothetical protein
MPIESQPRLSGVSCSTIAADEGAAVAVVDATEVAAGLGDGLVEPPAQAATAEQATTKRIRSAVIRVSSAGI